MKTVTWILIHVLLIQLIVIPCVRAQEAPETKRIALVDFRNLTDDGGLDRYKKSIPDQIQTLLAGTGTLRLVERGQLEVALQELKLGMDAIVDDQTAVRLGRLLNANAIITGSYHKEGNLLQFTARVIEVETGEVITGVIERCRIGGDVFDAIDRLANKLIEQLRIHKWSDVIFQPPPVVSQTPEKKSKNTFLWIGLGALVATGTVIILAGGSDKKEASSPTGYISVEIPVNPGEN